MWKYDLNFVSQKMRWIFLGKDSIKPKEMRDLFCIKFLEKDKNLDPFVITKYPVMELPLW